MKNLKQLKSTIADQNPWWTDHFVPDYLAHSRERPLSKYLRKRILSSSLKRHLIILDQDVLEKQRLCIKLFDTCSTIISLQKKFNGSA